MAENQSKKVEEYPKRFIREIERRIVEGISLDTESNTKKAEIKNAAIMKINARNKKIYNLFEKEKDKFPTNTIADVIKECLNEYFDGYIYKDDLIPIIETIKKKRFNKRDRWHKKFIAGIKSAKITSKEHPLNMFYTGLSLMDPETYIEIYKTSTIESVIESKIRDEVEWKKDVESALVEFPSLTQFCTWKSIYASLKVDVILYIWNYILTDLNGNIESFYNYYPKEFIGKPIFTPNAFQFELQEQANTLISKIITDDEGNTLLEINPTKEGINPFKVMDATDLKITTVFLSAIDNSFYDKGEVRMNFNSLCERVAGYSPNKNYREAIKKRCTNMISFGYTGKIEGGSIGFNLFDSIEVFDEIESPVVIARFGKYFQKAIINNKIISVAKDDFDKIDDYLCQILFSALQQERIVAQQNGKTFVDLTYSFFISNIQFKSRNKVKNLKGVATSLQSFVKNDVLIKECKLVDNEYIHIEFIPLSAEEAADVNFEKTEVIPLLP